MRRSIAHLIIGLAKGGAETALYQVLKYQVDFSLEHRVISLGAAHYYEPLIRELGVELIDLDLRRHPFKTLVQAGKAIQGVDCLCCWMYHANFIGYYFARCLHIPRLIWCIRHANLDTAVNKKTTLWISEQCAKRSKKVDVIAYNGIAARKVHEEKGYSCENGKTLDNGCDCEAFAPIIDAKKDLCKELGVPESKKIILSITKDYAIKDVPGFIRAFGMLHKIEQNAIAVVCGYGITAVNDSLKMICKEQGLILGKDIFLLGLRHDIPRLLSACDLYVLHSLGEAFPNTLLQAMACECLCLTTDVGDARLILAQDDQVVPSGDTEALFQNMERLLRLSKKKDKELRKQNRKRAREAFDIRRVIAQYEAMFYA